MMEEGNYISSMEAYLAIPAEQERIANHVYFFFRDGMGGFPEGMIERNGGAPDEINQIKELLATPEGNLFVAEKMDEAMEQIASGEKRLRFRSIITPEELRSEVEDLAHERVGYPTKDDVAVKREAFITQDEIDALLTRGSGFAHGQFRIYEYFLGNPDAKEAATFLKQEYGTGGSTHALPGADHSYQDHDAKGLRIRKGDLMQPEQDLILSWNVVQKRIRTLIAEDKYLTPEKKEAYEEYKAEREAKAMAKEQERLAESEESEQEIMETVTDEAENKDVEAESDMSEWQPVTDDLIIPFDEPIPPAGKSQTVIEGEENGLPYDIVIEKMSAEEEQLLQPDMEEPEAETVTEPLIDKSSAENFKITDDSLGVGSAKEKFHRNIEAIRTLEQIESEQRIATPEEQQILSQYVGWGGLADAFDDSKSAWATEYAQLKELLSPEEYASARESTLNAHYTSPAIIRNIYEALDKMGFEKGNVLEPAMGIGNFFGMIPEKMQDSRLYGVELDGITGRIAKQLYPEADIKVTGYEKTDFPNDFFDVAVGNVPFGQYKVSDRQYDKNNFLIHDYFFAKTLDKVRPGGVVAFVTSKGTMDKKSPEVRKFKESADIQTADMLNLPVPEAEYENVVLKPSEQQKDMVQSLADRAEAVRDRRVDSSVDNMLKITNDGRKLALDQRLINDMLPDDETSKAATCVEKAYDIWQETADKKSTQLIFCDLSTPKGDGTFNVYEDIKTKLMEKGVPEKEIAFIHDANTELRKAELFAKVRSGQVRFLLGSTAKMGAGTNVQDKLIALHHLDVPWRPSDIEQQEGRILRQGNTNEKVKIFRYVTEGTFDSYSWQLIENKQKFIGQIMTSKSPVRSCEDIDEAALSYAEVKALATGNPYIKEKMDLDIQVSKLKLMKANHTSQIYSLEDNILKNYPMQIANLKSKIEGLKKDIATFKEHKPKMPERVSMAEVDDKKEKEPFTMTVANKTYDDRKEAGAAIIAMCREMKSSSAPVPIGEYMGLKMAASFDSFNQRFVLSLKGELSHNVEVGADPSGNITRINNVLEGLEKNLADAETRLANVEHQLEVAKEEVTKPFAQEAELAEKLDRLAELNALLNMDEKDDSALSMEDEPENAEKQNEAEPAEADKSDITQEKQPTQEETPVIPIVNARNNYAVESGNPQGFVMRAAMADKPAGRPSLKEKLEEMKAKSANSDIGKNALDKAKNKEETL